MANRSWANIEVERFIHAVCAKWACAQTHQDSQDESSDISCLCTTPPYTRASLNLNTPISLNRNDLIYNI